MLAAVRARWRAIGPLRQLITSTASGPEAQLAAAASLPPEPRPAAPTSGRNDVDLTLRAAAVISLFRTHGHLIAMLDPLGRYPGPSFSAAGVHPHAAPLWRLLRSGAARSAGEMDLSAVGLGLASPATPVYVGDALLAADPTRDTWPMGEVLEHLRRAYTQSLTLEAADLADPAHEAWLRARVERPRAPGVSAFAPATRRRIHRLLCRSENFEHVLGSRFPGTKRFGIEGGEALLPGLIMGLEVGAAHGLVSVEIGMAHRGRLNVLHNILGKPLKAIASEFRRGSGAAAAPDDPDEDTLHLGDVKYHLGASGLLPVPGGHAPLRLSLTPNPSHLEMVGAVVLGKTRARQGLAGDAARRQGLAVVLHGDAAFIGQGLTSETLQLCRLKGFTTGGTLHIALNNQLGFTTEPSCSRSSPHCTALAKSIGAPVFHVSADDPEAVVWAMRTAVAFRQRFGSDVVVDLVGYRRHGHNELEDASITQPTLTAAISAHPTALALYEARLVAEGAATADELAAAAAEIRAEMLHEWTHGPDYVPTELEWQASTWAQERINVSALLPRRVRETLEESLRKRLHRSSPTGAPRAALEAVGAVWACPPAGFQMHAGVAAVLAQRVKMARGEVPLDWPTAEALAIGTLLLERDAVGNPQAHPVRLSGQDCERGTFNQRHAVLHDSVTGATWTPFERGLAPTQAPFEIINSPLSEAAVLAFEYGWSVEHPHALVLFEAQFGDFMNVAQAVIDNFIASGEDKWQASTALTLLLPHGYEGQGPEHSSARLERFLQLVKDDPDAQPGFTPEHVAAVAASWAVADPDGRGWVSVAALESALAEFRAQAAAASRAAAEDEAEPAAVLLASVRAFVGMGAGEGPSGPPTAAAAAGGESDPGPGRVSRAEFQSVLAAWAGRRRAARAINLSVVQPTTPANYFHVLRRQVHRTFVKPLILMAPKSLMHHRACSSPLAALGECSTFEPLIVDGGPGDNLAAKLVAPEAIRRLIICSGKLAYHLAQARRARKVTDVALCRLEELAPFPADRFALAAARFPNAELCFVQEEPKNMGGFSYVSPRLHAVLQTAGQGDLRTVRYIGRPAAASPATGCFARHSAETGALIDLALAAR